MVRNKISRQLRRLQKIDHSFDGVLQLAHIAGPGVVHKHLHHLSVNMGDVFFHRNGVAPDKAIRQERNVVEPVPERNHLDCENVGAVVQILAEISLADLFPQVLVGRKNNAHIHRPDACAADAQHRFVLNNPQ